MKIKFANQTRALLYLERHLYNGEPFFYIAEPAHMGKTYFIQEVSDRCNRALLPPSWGELEGSKPESWWTISVDLAGDRTTTTPKLYKKLLTAMEVTGLSAANQASDRILRALLEKMDLHQKRAIFLIDGAEYLSEEAARALWELFGTLRHAFEPYPAFRPAALIGSRCAFTAWEAYPDPAMKRVELTPFAPVDIVAILKEARAAATPWKDNEYEGYARKIFESSMGHPGCTAAMITHLDRNVFREREPQSDAYFAKYVVPYIQKNILTRAHLANHKRLKKDDQARLSQVLRELSTYRIIIPPWIRAVALKIDPNMTPRDLQELESRIVNCPLVTPELHHGWYVLAPSVRRLLEHWLDLESPDRKNRHGAVARQYAEWLDEREDSVARKSPAAEDRLALVIEFLFHSTISVSYQGTELIDYLKRQLGKNIARLTPWFEGQRLEGMIRTRLTGDIEFRTLVVERTSERHFRDLLESVRL